MRDAFLKTLTELASTDPGIMLITADLGFGVFEEFEQRFPKQYLNVGVAEQNMTGIATGLALEGYTVFTYSIGNFPTLRCLEQIRNDACYHNANINIVCTGGGFSYGALGMSHHATEDLAIMRALPEVTVVAPCDQLEAAAATKALAKSENVGYLRIDKTCVDISSTEQLDFQLGKARILRQGKDISFICTGGIAKEALLAADSLDKHGIQARVISMHTLKPLDETVILNAAKETPGIITIEEGNLKGGLFSAIAETCMDHRVLPGFIDKIGVHDTYSSLVGSQEFLRKHYDMDSRAIIDKAKSHLRI